MTRIRLDATTAALVRAAEGRVLLCDEGGKPIRTCLMFDPASLDEEPELSEEEWALRAGEQETYSTAQVLEILRRLGKP